jgi:PAS domain S-box-containing protein
MVKNWKIFDKSLDIHILLSHDLKIQKINPAFEKVFQLSISTVKNHDFFQIFNQKELYKIISTLKKDNEVITRECIIEVAETKNKFTIVTSIGFISEFNQYHLIISAPEQSLSSSSQSAIYGYIDGIFWEANAETFEFTFLSPQVKSILGYTPEEWLDTPNFWQNHIHPEDRDGAINHCHLETQKGNDHVFDYRMQKKDGEYIWVQDRVTVLQKNGKPYKLRGLIININSEKNEKLEIESEKALINSIIQNLPSVFFLFNQNGELLLWNKQLQKITGYGHKEIASKIVEEFFEGEEKNKVNYHIQEALKKGNTELEAWLSTKKNGKVPMFITASTIQYKGEICVFGTGTDISQRLSLLQELQLLINNTDEAFMYLDEELHVVTFNQQMKTHYELLFQKELKKGLKLTQLVKPDQKDELNKIVKEVWSGNNAKAILKINENNDLKHYQLKFRPILSDNKRIAGMFITSLNVTGRIHYESALKASNERLELVMKAGYDSIWDFDAVKEELFLGEGYLNKYGVDHVKAKNNIELHDALVHPDDFQRFKNSITTALEKSDVFEWEDQYRFLKKDRKYAHVKDRAIILRDKDGKALRMVGAISDISKEYVNNQLDKLEKQLMEESISASESIKGVLGKYLEGVENLFKDLNTSILSIEHKRLKNFISPNLPQGLIDAIEGLPIGLNQGSCGTAAFTKERVIVKDVFNDERWGNYTDLAQKYNFNTCWSQPIFNSKGEVIATFAIYFKSLTDSQEFGISLFDRSAKLLSVILQNFNSVEKIQQSNKRFKFINKATNNAIYDWDVLNDSLYWGDSLTRVFGHNIHQKDFKLDDWAQWVHPEDIDEVLQSLDIFMADQHETKWSYEYRFKDANGQYAYVEDVGYLIRGEKGQPIRMIGALRDQTQMKQGKIKKELQQEISLLFREYNLLAPALHSCLKYLTEYSNFSLGEIWLINQEKDCIRLVSKYGRTQSALDFYDFEIPSEFEIGEGLPGKVWKEGKLIFWNDISKNDEFLRSKPAKATGLKSAIGYPIFYGQAIVGVLLLAKDIDIDDNSYEISNFRILEKFLGEEIKRKQQEEELKLFFESAPDILAVANASGYFVKVNPAFCDLLGFSKEELTSKPFINLIHPDDLILTQEEYDKTKTGEKQSKNFINRYRTKSGDYKWISWSSSEAFGSDGLVFAFGRDVTEIVDLQQTVENATKLARVGGWEINMLTNEQYWSPMTKEIHEVPEDSTINLDQAINFYHPDFRDLVRNSVDRAIEKGESFDFEAKIITGKENEKWVRAIGKAEFEKGKCTKLYGSFQDIHNRKIAEERLKNISNNIPGVLFQYHLKPDGSDHLDFVSKGSEEIFGFTPEECMQSTAIIWDRIEAGGDMPEMTASYLESAKDLTPWHFVWRYHHPNGLLRYHEGSGNPQKLADGTIIWDSIITDITDLRDLEILAERTSELAKIGSWELNLIPEEKEVFWSPMTRKILEVEPDYVPSFSEGLAFYTDHSKSLIEEGIKNLINKGQEFDLELLIKTKSGKEKWVRCIGQADRIQNKTSRIFGSYQDIDQQKRTELAVQTALKEREDILESIGDAFFAVDHDWIVTYWNKEAEKVLGKKRDEILGKNLWDEYGEAINLKFHTEYHKAMELQQTVHFEEYFPPLEKWFEVSAYPSEKGLSVYFKDVTLRKTAEEKIKASNERFEKVALATNDAIWDWDLKTDKVLRAGLGFQNQFGYKIEEADDDNDFWKRLVHQEDLPEVLKSQKRALHDPKCNFWQSEYRFKKKSGEYAAVLDKGGYIVRNESGEAFRMIGATTDITDRKNYEKSLLEINERLEKQAHELSISNAELEQFAYVASHDLQEPLRMVSGFLTQLEKKYGDQLDEKAHQYIDFAVDGAKRMRQIILDLLEFSKIGKEDEELVKVDLNEVVHEVCLLHRKQIEDLNAEVLFDNLPIIIGHPSPMIQLFQNLISNGLKYRDPKIPPKVLIKARELKKEWKFSVEDNGIGIEKEYFERIFNIFQRLHNKTEYSGTGMGLAIVKKIIENQNGKIWLESEKGKGTIFYFTLPKI